MSWLYAVGKVLVASFLKIGGARYWGRENIPENEPVLVVCNHVSFGDPLALGVAFPTPIVFVAKEAFRHNFFAKLIFGALGAVFLNKGENDLTAMRKVINELRAGHTVGIFPEGTRHYDQKMGEFKFGASYIAARANVRVLPVSVINTGDFWRFWKRNIIVNIGKPLEIDRKRSTDREYLAEQTQLYREKVAELFEESRKALLAEGRKMLKQDKSTYCYK